MCKLPQKNSTSGTGLGHKTRQNYEYNGCRARYMGEATTAGIGFRAGHHRAVLFCSGGLHPWWSNGTCPSCAGLLKLVPMPLRVCAIG